MNIKHNLITPKYSKNNIFLREIKSFVIRRKKLNKSQILAIKNFWMRYCISFKDSIIDLNTIFNEKLPIVLDIGFGSGKALIDMASKNSNLNFLGIEVYLPGIVSSLKLAHKLNLKNLKFIYHDAVEVIQYMIASNTIFKIILFFPDPWSKKKHHKRRIFTDIFITLISKKLINNGILHVVTDCKSYANDIIKKIKSLKKNNHLIMQYYFINKPYYRLTTKFESRGIALGNIIFDLIFLNTIF
ncbi:tRNA (guanosine(46)-N7)-methyltransferase TrmB [Buchnera aphidicola (Hormaphis cornu)]|nr:tRNA (guanosine(46)-N7)-methyltransferase TrmB [Buchnera aphidicola (Hormaphis cornu)]